MALFGGMRDAKYLASINPIWKYYGIGYGISRKKEKRTTA